VPLTIDDVLAPTLASEIEAEVLSLCATASPALPVTSWEDGNPYRTIIWAVSQVVAAKSLVEIEIAKGGLGDFASGLWAKLFAQQIYNVLFIPAAPATGSVKFTNNGVINHGTFQPGQLTVGHNTTGLTYRNQSAVTISPGPGFTTPAIPIQADVVGIVGNAAPNTVQKMVTSLVGVTVSNENPVLGADEESTQALVTRARNKLQSLSPLGPKGVYDYVARTPLDQFPVVDGTLLTPTSSPITRTRSSADAVTGEVTTYLATATGAPVSGDVDLVNLAYYRWAEPWGQKANALAAAEVVVSVSYQVWLRSSLTSAQVQMLIQAALITYFAMVPVGGVVIPPDDGALYAEAIENVIHGAVPGIVRVLVTVPAVPVTDLLPNQIPVLGTVAATVSFI
jgi:hypothetical protein